MPDLRLLRSFVILAEELHFGRAAERLHVVPAALSQQVRNLEQMVGAKLFDRTTRRVALTPVGDALLGEAVDAIDAADRAWSRARRAARGELGVLRLGFVSAAAIEPLPQVLSAFAARTREVDLQLVEAGTEEQLEALSTGRLDVGFVLGPQEHPGLERAVLGERRLAVVVPSAHRFASRRRVRLGELADEPVVWMKKDSEPSLFRHYAELCRENGFEPQVRYQVDHLVSMFGLVAAGLGISFAPANAEHHAPPAVSFVRLEPRVNASVLLVWDPRSASPVVERFVEVATDARERADGAGR